MIRAIRARLCICASHHTAIAYKRSGPALSQNPFRVLSALTQIPRRGALPGTPSTHTIVHASSIIDLNGGGHTGREDDARRHLIDMDADRDALGKAHPGEDGVDRSDPLIVGLCVRNTDGAGDTVDMPAYDSVVPHEFDLGRIADADGRKVSFLEISIDPK